jgi:two-component system LytT family response regulator
MRVVLIEDEAIALRKLKNLLRAVNSQIEIVAELESVSDACAWFKNNSSTAIDIIFSDIQLSDGLSFEIFEQTAMSLPIIFTTAYDEYAIRAFKLNGIDYLLKPIQEHEIRNALTKYQNTKQLYNQQQLSEVQQLMRSFQPRQTLQKQAFLVYHKDKIVPLPCDDVACFYTQNQLVYALLYTGQKFTIQETLEDVEKRLNPEEFFRANRQFIIARKALVEAEIYFNNRLTVKLNPPPPDLIIISREKVAQFRQWLQGIF